MSAVALERHEHEQSAFSQRTWSAGRYTVTWTAAVEHTSEIVGMQPSVHVLAHDLERTVRLGAPLHVHVFAHADTYADLLSADLYLRVGVQQRDGGTIEVADLLLGNAKRLRVIATGIEWQQLAPRLARLLKVYLVERCGRDTFGTWAQDQSGNALRERLGVAEPSHPSVEHALTNATPSHA